MLLAAADLIDGTPVLDIKPYVPFCEAVKGMAPPWVSVRLSYPVLSWTCPVLSWTAACIFAWTAPVFDDSSRHPTQCRENVYDAEWPGLPTFGALVVQCNDNPQLLKFMMAA